MRITILFGNSNQKHMVRVFRSPHQRVHPSDAKIRMSGGGDVEDKVHVVQSTGTARTRPSVRGRVQARPAVGVPLGQGLDQTGPRAACWCSACMAGRAENGEFQVVLRQSSGVPFTESGSASSHLAFDKIAAKHSPRSSGVERRRPTSRWKGVDEAFTEYGRLRDKAGARRLELWPESFVNARQDLVAVRNAAKTQRSCDRALHRGRPRQPAACWSAPTAGFMSTAAEVEFIPERGQFRLRRKKQH